MLASIAPTIQKLRSLIMLFNRFLKGDDANSIFQPFQRSQTMLANDFSECIFEGEPPFFQAEHHGLGA